ncbi:MAG: zinc-dependent peptidase [Bacteroidia bacterium]
MNTLDFSFLDKTISGQIRYYTHLSDEGKQRFCNRVKTFMQQKEFEGMEDFEVTDEVRILISAAAVQLTFGLHDYSLEGHHLIRIFPTTFYNTRTGAEYKGLTLQQRLTVLSWEDFEQGYLIDDDNFNLGLHELAHVLRLSVNTDDFDRHFARYLDDWDEASNAEFERMQNHPDVNFLRSYAATDMSEFFSVCAEYFFEVPEKFSMQLPEIYNHLCMLLNQNPLNIRNDYRLNEFDGESDQNANELKETFFLFREWSHHVDTFIAISFFVGLLCIWPLISRMKINFGTFCTIGVYAFFAMLVVTKLYRIAFTIRKIDSIDIMRMVLLSPFISLLIFVINYLTPGEKKYDSYSIMYINVREIDSVTDEAITFFKNDELNDFIKLRTFKTNFNTYQWDKVSYEFETGIFNYQNLISRTIVNKDKTQIPYYNEH